MIRTYLIFSFLFFFASSLFAQQGNNWAFGLHGGLTFNTDPPSAFQDSINFYESGYHVLSAFSSSISDCQGKMLFYTSGGSTWNRKNFVMPNGHRTIGDSSQDLPATFTIQKPGDSFHYYVFFTLGTNNSYPRLDGLYYYTIDMRLDSGYGDAIDTINVRLFNKPGYDLSITKQSNDTDYWMLFKPNASDSVYCYPITSKGIGPAVKNYAKNLNSNGSFSMTKFSHKGNKVVFVRTDPINSKYAAVLYDFDNKTALISNPRYLFVRKTIYKNLGGCGIEFSGSDSMLYINTVDNFYHRENQIWQYETYSKNPDSTGVKLWDYKTLVGVQNVTGLQIGPNGKIYHDMCTYSQLSVINFPERKGKNCKFQLNVIDVSPATCGYTMPSLYFPIHKIIWNSNASNSSGCVDTVKFTNNSDTVYFHSFRWYFGDGDSADGYNAKHRYSASGKYLVKLAAKNSCLTNTLFSDSVQVNIPIIAGFSIDSIKYACGSAMTYIHSTSKGDSSHYFDFGDGSILNTDSLAFHKYSGPGVFTIRQAVSNTACVDTAKSKLPVKIEAYPASAFQTKDTAGCQPYRISLKNNCTNSYSRKWFYDDGSTDTLMNPIHSFRDTGFHSIKMVSYNHQGCSDTLIRSNLVYVSSDPVSKFKLNADTQCSKVIVSFYNLSSHQNSCVWNFGDGSSLKSMADTVFHTYTKAGSYKALLTSSNPYCKDTFSQLIPVFYRQLPLVSTNASKLKACVPFTVNFNNLSKNTVSYRWDFGDGSLDTNKQPSHIYKDTGLYSISLFAMNSLGCKDSVTYKNYIYVSPVPIPSFYTKDSIQCEFSSFAFKDSSKYSNTWKWDFGDGKTDSVKSPAHTYNVMGLYKVKLSTSNNFCSNTSDFTSNIQILAAPTPAFKLSATVGCTPLTIKATNMAKGSIASWVYTSGNGNSDTNVSTQFTYPSAGIYYITQKLQNSIGCSSKDSALITVTTQPKASFVVKDSLKVCQAINYVFNDRSFSATSYLWDFGDGVRDSVPSPLHTFSKNGTYIVSLHVQNAGCSDTRSQKVNIDIRPKPAASFSADQKTACITHAFQFSNFSTNTDSFAWDFGDGIKLPDTAKKLNHIYSKPGNKVLTLKCFSKEGCADSFSLPITILDTFKANMSLNPKVGCLPLTVSGSSGTKSKDMPLTYTWAFGDSGSYGGQSITHLYQNQSAGKYKVILKVTNGYCSDSVIDFVTLTSIDKKFRIEPFLTTVQNNQNVFLKWYGNPFATKYKVERSKGDANFSFLKLVSDTSLTDNDVLVSQHSYSYRITAVDACGNQSLPSSPLKTILLRGETTNDESINLDWNTYRGWVNKQYALLRSDDEGLPTNLAITNDSNFTDQNFFKEYAQMRVYYVEAISAKNDSLHSRSNVVTKYITPALWIPNSFSPNGDGLNDEFRISCSGIQQFHISIYDRWGEKIFESNSLQNPWNGTFKNEKPSEGAYIYKIEAQTTSNQWIYRKGSLMILH
jgi:gliding motility-associated-like protein